MRKTLQLLGVTVIAVGVLGSVASISAGWGWFGVAISIVLAGSILWLCLLSLAPVLHKNERGVTLLQAVDSVGLVDIENREDLTAPLPPHQFYEKAQHEIAITGISAYRIFDQHLEVLKSAIRSGKRVFVLILHPGPESRCLDELSKIEGKDVRADIHEVLRVVKSAGLHAQPGFRMRFRNELPPFTGVMIDGDLEPTGEVPSDGLGQIRVQPASAHRSQHKGVVFQLRKTEGRPPGTFDFFAEDLRNQWKTDGREDHNLFGKVMRYN